jgi:hypothetical protein
MTPSSNQAWVRGVKYLSEHTADRIRELAFRFKVNQADVVAVAVDLLDFEVKHNTDQVLQRMMYSQEKRRARALKRG